MRVRRNRVPSARRSVVRVPNGHHLVNRTSKPAVFLEVGDRLPGDSAEYTDHDLQVRATPAGWRYRHKDGSPYE